MPTTPNRRGLRRTEPEPSRFDFQGGLPTRSGLGVPIVGVSEREPVMPGETDPGYLSKTSNPGMKPSEPTRDRNEGQTARQGAAPQTIPTPFVLRSR